MTRRGRTGLAAGVLLAGLLAGCSSTEETPRAEAAPDEPGGTTAGLGWAKPYLKR